MTDSTSSERWLPVPGYEGFYEISDFGRVRSIDRVVVDSRGRPSRRKGTAIAESADKKGYRHVGLYRGSVPVYRTVHSLVLEAFVGPCPDGLECLHGDGDPANNRLSNLRYGTSSENKTDMLVHGRHHQLNKTHCPRSHPLTLPNLIASQLKKGSRTCLACDRARSAIKNVKRRGVEPAHDLQTLSDMKFIALTEEFLAELQAVA